MISFYITKWKNFENWSADTGDITFGNMVKIWLTLWSIGSFENLQNVLLLANFYKLGDFSVGFVFDELIFDINDNIESFKMVLVWFLHLVSLPIIKRYYFKEIF